MTLAIGLGRAEFELFHPQNQREALERSLLPHCPVHPLAVPNSGSSQVLKNVLIIKHFVLLYARTSRSLGEFAPHPCVHCSFFDFRLQDSVNERTSLITHQDMCAVSPNYRISLTLRQCSDARVDSQLDHEVVDQQRLRDKWAAVVREKEG